MIVSFVWEHSLTFLLGAGVSHLLLSGRFLDAAILFGCQLFWLASCWADKQDAEKRFP
jgi:hypothetical protein